MNNLNKNRWQVRLAALLIFLLRVAAGALTPRIYHAWHSRGAAHEPEGFAQMLDRLQLSADQKTQVQQILGDTREQLRALHKQSEPRVEGIRRQTDERLQRVFTPAQSQQFQQT